MQRATAPVNCAVSVKHVVSTKCVSQEYVQLVCVLIHPNRVWINVVATENVCILIRAITKFLPVQSPMIHALLNVDVIPIDLVAPAR